MHRLWTLPLLGFLSIIEVMANFTQELLNTTAQRDVVREEAALKIS